MLTSRLVWWQDPWASLRNFRAVPRELPPTEWYRLESGATEEKDTAPWEAPAFKGGGSQAELPVTIHARLCIYMEEQLEMSEEK